MKSVLMSIRPKWCELICRPVKMGDGTTTRRKTLELRKTAPEAPFKGFIYCTKAKEHFSLGGGLYACRDTLYRLPAGEIKFGDAFELWADWGGQHDANNILNGKVIGEFICDYVLGHCEMANADIAEMQGCVPREDILKYSNGKEVKGWHISDLVIYDKPKELGEFYKECEQPDCDDCPHLHFENTPNSYEGWCEFDEKIPITRPPQSWCYVEEVKDNG